MIDELKSIRVCYGEEVQMMRVDDCIVFGNKDSLRRIVEKMTERTAKVEQIPDEEETIWDVCECGADVYRAWIYCPNCGGRLEWG